MNSKIKDTITEPEDIFGTPEYVDTPDIASRMRVAKKLLDFLRDGSAQRGTSTSSASNSARR
ncbi:hypothetical protein [Dechloromonas sp. A34]|uniref:hypothetical protein n=1 Tax=Dechloromonas sp. A34 TaxID=447588 RepID=UPI002249516D|nr:hypothetical protein [Dechloromonas sp. A34]